eukprot:COSAG02_NODE_2675_length_8272_cov_3.246391_6_plen_96_part_01
MSVLSKLSPVCASRETKAWERTAVLLIAGRARANEAHQPSQLLQSAYKFITSLAGFPPFTRTKKSTNKGPAVPNRLAGRCSSKEPSLRAELAILPE